MIQTGRLDAPLAISARRRLRSGTVRPTREDYPPGDGNCLGRAAKIRTRATCQSDEFSLCTSKIGWTTNAARIPLTKVTAFNRQPLVAAGRVFISPHR